MKKSLLLLCIIFCTQFFQLNAQTECKTIAEIKALPTNTYVKYTGTATTTFYNGTYGGLFMEDETGGILLKGYTLNAKNKDWVTDSMSITNVYATWSVGTSGTAPGIKVDSDDKEKPERTSGVAFVPTRLTMSEFFANQSLYEGKAVVITDAVISPKVGTKYYMNNGVDSVNFTSSNVSSSTPAGGEMAGVFLGQQYNRFLLCSGELTKATEFHSFVDMSSYYANKDFEVIDAKVSGAVLVNYVTKIADTQSAIFAQYLAPNGRPTGITIFVEGATDIVAGDSINGFYGRYTDSYKNRTNKKDFKGAYFNQATGKSLNVCNQNNEVSVNADVNTSDLITSDLAMYYASQIIYSRRSGILCAKDNKYYFVVSYDELDTSGSTDVIVQVIDSISVVGANGLDLAKYLGDGIIIGGVYDACVIHSEPTIVIRDVKDILATYYEYNNIAEIIEAGEPYSPGLVYGLKNEVVVNYKRTQTNSGVKNTWMFVEDETGVMAIDLGSNTTKAKVGDKIKGLKGIYNDGVNLGMRAHAPQYKLLDDAVIEIVSSDNELNVLKATLKEVIQDTLKYCSHIVEVTNVGGSVDTIMNETGVSEDYYIYDTTDSTYVMHYQPQLHTGDPIIGDNFILKGLVNFNCLDGYYVIYRITIQEGPTVDSENVEFKNANVYSSNGIVYVETVGGQKLEVYTIDGQCVYSTCNSSNLTEIGDLSGVVIVKVDGVVYKTFVR